MTKTKAIVAALLTILAAFSNNILSTSSPSRLDYVAAALSAVMGFLGVYLTPNKPKAGIVIPPQDSPGAPVETPGPGTPNA